MTQPIQEPTVARTQRAHKYGIDQLFRRPCTPCGEAVIPFAYFGWSYQGNDFIPYSVPGNGTFVALATLMSTYPDGAFGFISDETVFFPYPANGELIALGVNDGDTGLFLARGTVQFDSAPAEFAFTLKWEGLGGVANDDAYSTNEKRGDASLSGETGNQAIFMTIPTGEGNAITCNVAQDSGSAEDLLSMSFYIARLAAYNFDMDTHYPPFPDWP